MDPQRPIQMSGSATFNAFSYLFNGAKSLSQTAKEQLSGSNYCRISAALFSAFTIEAHLNHIGELKLPFWAIVEPKLSWRNKIDLIAQHLNVESDFGTRPFQTLIDLFKFRDRLAHGKTKTKDTTYDYHENGEDEFDALNPEWLKKFWSDAALDLVIEDTFKVMKLFHEAAGFEEQTLACVSSGEFTEQPDCDRPN